MQTTQLCSSEAKAANSKLLASLTDCTHSQPYKSNSGQISSKVLIPCQLKQMMSLQCAGIMHFFANVINAKEQAQVEIRQFVVCSLFFPS